MPASKSGIWKNPKHGTRTGYANYRCRCAECIAWNTQAMRIQRTKNPGRFRAYAQARYKGASPKAALRDMVLRKYGMTHIQYEAMLVDQNSQCAICLETPKGNKSLYVDHDHGCCVGQKSCGRCIRGLLCARCNNAIALLGDTKKGVERALKYLSAPYRVFGILR